MHPFLILPSCILNQLKLFRKLLGYVIVQTGTNLLTERHATGDDLVPVGFGQLVEVCPTDAILQQTEHESGIEVIACTNGAHGLQRCYRIILL